MGQPSGIKFGGYIYFPSSHKVSLRGNIHTLNISEYQYLIWFRKRNDLQLINYPYQNNAKAMHNFLKNNSMIDITNNNNNDENVEIENTFEDKEDLSKLSVVFPISNTVDNIRNMQTRSMVKNNTLSNIINSNHCEVNNLYLDYNIVMKSKIIEEDNSIFNNYINNIDNYINSRDNVNTENSYLVNALKVNKKEKIFKINYI